MMIKEELMSTFKAGDICGGSSMSSEFAIDVIANLDDSWDQQSMLTIKDIVKDIYDFCEYNGIVMSVERNVYDMNLKITFAKGPFKMVRIVDEVDLRFGDSRYVKSFVVRTMQDLNELLRDYERDLRLQINTSYGSLPDESLKLIDITKSIGEEIMNIMNTKAITIDKVIFNNPATIVYWKDGEKNSS